MDKNKVEQAVANIVKYGNEHKVLALRGKVPFLMHEYSLNAFEANDVVRRLRIRVNLEENEF